MFWDEPPRFSPRDLSYEVLEFDNYGTPVVAIPVSDRTEITIIHQKYDPETGQYSGDTEIANGSIIKNGWPGRLTIACVTDENIIIVYTVNVSIDEPI